MVVRDHAFVQKATQKNAACQIDYLIQTQLNTLFASEVKFSRSPIGAQVIDEMKERLGRLKLPRRFSCFPVLIHVNGVTDAVVDAGYFTKIIDFSELLN